MRYNTTFFIFVGHLPHPNIPEGAAGVSELMEAQDLRTELQSTIPGLGEAHMLRRLKLVDVEVKIIVADLAHDYRQYLEASFVTIGSGGSNGISKEIEGRLPVRIHFTDQQIQILDKRLDSRDRALIVCHRRGGGTAWFYLAGQTEPDTAAAARFLKENWFLLARKYSRHNFYCLIDTAPTKTAFSRASPELLEDSVLY